MNTLMQAVYFNNRIADALILMQVCLLLYLVWQCYLRLKSFKFISEMKARLKDEVLDLGKDFGDDSHCFLCRTSTNIILFRYENDGSHIIAPVCLDHRVDILSDAELAIALLEEAKRRSENKEWPAFLK